MPNLAVYGLPLAPARGGLGGARVSKLAGLRIHRPVAATPPGKPVPPRKPMTPGAMSPLAVITNYARARKTVVLTYRKKTDNLRQIIREVEPYEIKDGYLWAFCLPHSGIHKFLLGNIVAVQGTNRRYYPRWPVRL